jgi:hypothetical protein
VDPRAAYRQAVDVAQSTLSLRDVSAPLVRGSRPFVNFIRVKFARLQRASTNFGNGNVSKRWLRPQWRVRVQMAKFTMVDLDNDGMLSREEFYKMGEKHYEGLGETRHTWPWHWHSLSLDSSTSHPFPIANHRSGCDFPHSLATHTSFASLLTCTHGALWPRPLLDKGEARSRRLAGHIGALASHTWPVLSQIAEDANKKRFDAGAINRLLEEEFASETHHGPCCLPCQTPR